MQAARIIFASGFPHVALQIAFLQSAGLLAQLSLAPRLGATEFAVIRVAEVAYSYLSIVAGLGLTAVTAREVARAGGDTEIRDALATCARLGFLASAVMSPVLYVVVHLTTQVSTTALLPLVFALPANAFSRTAMGYMQGRRQMQRMAVYGVASGLIVFGALVAGTVFIGTSGWFAGRAFGEVASAALLGFAIRKDLGGTFRANLARRAVRLGSANTLAILIDRASTLDVLILQATLAVGAAGIGTFGLVTAAGSALLLPAAALNVLVLPRFAAASTRHVADALTKRAALIAAGAAGGGALLLSAVGMTALSVLRDYENVGSMAVPVLLTTPLHASTSIFGTRLFAAGMASTSARINALTTMIYLLTLVPVAVLFGVFGVAMLFAANTVLRFIWYRHAVRSLRNEGGA
jgi:O-antigen/teichoic acid export membrane protein